MRRVVRNTGIILGIVCLIVGIALIVADHHKKPDPIDYPVCSSQAPPCIKIVEHDGTSYGLNDFVFYGRGCVSFISLPDRVQRHTCDKFELKWIGKDPAAA